MVLFRYTCSLLYSVWVQKDLQPCGGSFRLDTIAPATKLGVTLMWLATGNSYAQLQNIWNLGISTISGIIYRTVRVLWLRTAQNAVAMLRNAVQ